MNKAFEFLKGLVFALVVALGASAVIVTALTYAAGFFKVDLSPAKDAIVFLVALFTGVLASRNKWL